MIDEEVLKIALNDKTFSRNEAIEIVKGKKRFFNLVDKGLIRCKKPAAGRQNGRWYCNAYDVIKYARI